MTELSSACQAIWQAPSEEHLVALLDQWSPQWKWRGRQRAIGAGAYERYCTLGLYAFGGNAPNVSKASSMKEACMAINHFMRHRFPNGTWTSIAVLLNPRIGLHRDMQNMVGKLNHAIALGSFSGGRVWIEDDEHLRAASMKPKSLQNSVSKRGTVVESFFCQLSSQLGSHFWSLGLSIGARKTVSKGFLGL